MQIIHPADDKWIADAAQEYTGRYTGKKMSYSVTRLMSVTSRKQREHLASTVM